MVALAVSGIIIAAVYGAYISQQKTYLVQDQVAEMQQNLRAALVFLSDDIRMAGYDINSTGLFGISTASKTKMVFSADFDGNGVVGPGETLTYELYLPAGASMTALRRIAGRASVAENIEAIEFQYLDGSGNDLGPGGTVPSSSLNDIRAVRISVLARAKQPDRSYTDTSAYVAASGSVWPPFGDNYRRRLQRITVNCRNIGL